MRAVILRSLIVIGVGGLVLAAVLYVASTVDTRPPEVVGVRLTQPVSETTDRALITTSLEISFSEPVDPDGAASALAIDPPVDGSVSWSGTTMIFTPAEPLDIETEYEVRIEEGVRDLAGNEMANAPATFTFATAGRPELAEADPSDGAGDVPVDAVLTLVFSALMDTASVEAALDVQPPLDHDLRWSGERLDIVPRGALEPDTEYRITVDGTATDVSGVAIDRDLAVAFRTVAPGLGVTAVTPADRTDGIAPATPITVAFDRPIDPASISADLVEIEPPVAGSLDLVSLPDRPASSVVRFVPTAPLPANTTFEVTLLPGVRSEDGRGGMAEPIRWTFTTGAALATLSNQVLFLSDRSGVTNLWSMNADGTGQHQVSSEISPVLDYAAAPNGSSVVVADGRRLVFLRADGGDRQVLTGEDALEFDPTYAPDGSRVTFGRADAETGEGLGLWTWAIGSGAAEPVELIPDVRPGATASPGDDVEAAGLLRAPRYAPDGQALAFVSAGGWIGILELPAERFTRIEADAAGPPSWRPDSSGFLLPLGALDHGDAVAAPVEPLGPDTGSETGLVNRSGTRVEPAASGAAVRLLAIGPDGQVAIVDADGTLRLSDDPREVGESPAGLGGGTVTELAFGPAGRFAVIVVAGPGTTPDGRLERIDLETGERTELLRDGWSVRWLP